MVWLLIRSPIHATVLALTLFLSVRLTTASFRVLAEAALVGSESAELNKGGDLLAPNKPIQRELSAGEVHSYRIAVDSGQYVRIVVDQWGINLAVTLYSRDSQKLTELGCRQNGPTPVSLIAEFSGTYRLELHSLEKDPLRGRYQVKIEEIRPVEPSDKHRITAENAFAQGERLNTEWSVESQQKAIEKYEEALSYWRTAGNRQEEANTIKRIGKAYELSGNAQKALKYFNQALQVFQELSDHQAEGETLSDIGNAYLLLENKPKAREYCTQALKVSRAAGNCRGEAQALTVMGDIYFEDFRNREALELDQQALRLWRGLSDRRGQAQALLNLGYTCYVLSDTQKAMESFDHALALWRAVNDRRGEAQTLTVLGHLYSRAGEKQQALNLFEEAMQLVKPSGDKRCEANILNGIAYVYRELGEKERAIDYFKQALRQVQAVGYRVGENLQLVDLGDAYYSLGDARRALNYYQKALSEALSSGDKLIESLLRSRVGVVYESRGARTKALVNYNQALSLNRAVGNRRDEAYTLNNIGHIYYGQDQKEKALGYYNQALAINRSVGDRFGESLTLYNIAQAERGRGNLVEARSRLEEALKIIESLRTKVASQELRSSYFASEHQRYDFYIDLLMQLHNRSPAQGIAADALQASERARARSLAESLSEGRADIRQGIDPALLEHERSLRQSLSAKADRQMQLPSDKPNKEEAEALAKEIRDLTTEYDQVQAQIKSKSPRYAALTQPQPLSLQHIQEQVLDDNSLLLEYALGDERSYLWAVTKTGMTPHALTKRAEIEKAARHVYEQLIAPQPKAGETARQYQTRVREADSQYWTQAAALSQMLLGPVAEQLGNKRLLIVAEGALQYVPFQSLPLPRSGDGETRGRADGAVPLIVNHEIINLPSASVLAVLRNEIRDRRPASKAVAVIADPVFEADDPRVAAKAPDTVTRGNGHPRNGGHGDTAGDAATRRRGDAGNQRIAGNSPLPVVSASARRRVSVSPRPTEVSDLHRALRDVGMLREGGLSMARLLSSRQEAEAIIAAAAGAGMKATDFNASRATATSPELGQYRIVHFATHGLLNSEHPELSGLVLSLVDEQGKPQDGFLRLHDIYNLNLPADLVVLSACSTGLGKDVRGEGLVGIVRGFMYAGAARVVASLWKVDDEATAELMKRFYQQMLQGGLSPAAALRAAQVGMWQQKRWHAPYYWAAFQLQGEYK